MNKSICTFKGILQRADINFERSEFLIDYGTIIHRSQFRRLSNKAQVYLNPFIDYPRTRLTHSIEVEQIGRELSRFFTHKLLDKFNFSNSDQSTFSQDFEDLVAASCLAHDIGQAPFGHRGEKVLKKLMGQSGVSDINCFDANKQNIRLLLGNTSRKPYEVTCSLVDAVMKYKSLVFQKETKFPGYYKFEEEPLKKLFSISETHEVRHPACYIMEASDDIAYISSDIQDALKLKLITREEVLNLLENIELPQSLADLDKRKSYCQIWCTASGGVPV